MTWRVAIDTTGHGGSVVVGKDDAIVAEHVHDDARGYAEHLFGLLNDALDAARITREDLDEVLVVSGPGSFTGLRIGVMTAKTLAYGSGLVLRAAPTHGLVATDARGPAIALVPAGGGCVWRLEVEGAATVTAAQRPERVDIDALEAFDGEVLTADAALFARLAEQPVSCGPLRRTPSLGRLLLRAAAMDHSVVTVEDPLAFVPEYVSPSQAERAHGVDLREELGRPIRPRGWS